MVLCRKLRGERCLMKGAVGGWAHQGRLPSRASSEQGPERQEGFWWIKDDSDRGNDPVLMKGNTVQQALWKQWGICRSERQASRCCAPDSRWSCFSWSLNLELFCRTGTTWSYLHSRARHRTDRDQCIEALNEQRTSLLAGLVPRCISPGILIWMNKRANAGFCYNLKTSKGYIHGSAWPWTGKPMTLDWTTYFFFFEQVAGYNF